MGDCCDYFLGFFLPTVPVAMKRGCGADVMINLGLCCLGWLPGVIHSYYIISHTNEKEKEKEEKKDSPV